DSREQQNQAASAATAPVMDQFVGTRGVCEEKAIPHFSWLGRRVRRATSEAGAPAVWPYRLGIPGR
ncbi:hypothetical protein AHiyo6_33070, partial [Arthrobacter sp. Hiyo6]